MMEAWTKEDIERILEQLDQKSLPFQKYTFSNLGSGLRLLGKGGYASVYEAETRNRHRDRYAIKVIGFGDRRADSDSFRKSVETQKDLALFQDHVVKIFDSAELRVWIEGEDTVVKAQLVREAEDSPSEGNYLELQFIVMERMAPVLRHHGMGRPTLIPDALARFEEKEILKLAYDIGTALSQAHEKQIFHRDIKLENIFYTPRGNHYKLGDFGIAVAAKDGMASTVAFTRGYGAPEVVGALGDRYDHTADIYSFGMMLFVLLNELRFPESKYYHVNLRAQYSQGYVLPWPLHGSDELCRIVTKMCSFHPDDRYQSMDEVLNALEQLIYGRGVRYKREHKDLTLVVGTALWFAGAVVWKLSFMPDVPLDLSRWMYLFLILCVGKGVCKMGGKDDSLFLLPILGLGIFLMVTTGFAWWKFFGLFALLLAGPEWNGLFGAGVLITHGADLLTRNRPDILSEFQTASWIAVLLLSLAGIFLFQYFLLSRRDHALTRAYFKRNRYWFAILLAYASLFLIDYNYRKFGIYPDYMVRMVGPQVVRSIMSWNPGRLGVCGMIFCLMWMGREYMLMFVENHRENRLFKEEQDD